MADGINDEDPIKQLLDLQQELSALRRRIDHAADAPDRRQKHVPFPGPDRRTSVRRASDDPQKSDPSR